MISGNGFTGQSTISGNAFDNAANAMNNAPRTGDGIGSNIKSAVGGVVQTAGQKSAPVLFAGVSRTVDAAADLLRKKRGAVYGGIADKIVAMKDAAIANQMSKIPAAGTPTGNTGGLTQGALALAAQAAGYGLGVSSGYREGAVTEFGNASYHGMGMAVDVAGSPAGMMAFFQSLIGRPDILEAIYNGMIYKPGSGLTQYTGADQHTDHVHAAVGDGIGAVRAAGKSSGQNHIQVTFTGDFIINDGSSYEEVSEKIADGIVRAMESRTGERMDVG